MFIRALFIVVVVRRRYEVFQSNTIFLRKELLLKKSSNSNVELEDFIIVTRNVCSIAKGNTGARTTDNSRSDFTIVRSTVAKLDITNVDRIVDTVIRLVSLVTPSVVLGVTVPSNVLAISISIVPLGLLLASVLLVIGLVLEASLRCDAVVVPVSWLWVGP